MFKSRIQNPLQQKKAYASIWIKLFLCVISLNLLHSYSAHDLDRLHEHIENNQYRITPRAIQIRFNAPKNAGEAIKVVTRFQAIESDHTIVQAETFWSGTSNDNQYKDIRAYSDKGERMLLKSVGDRKWRVNTHPGEWVEIHYFIHPNKNAEQADTQYRAILNNGIFHGAGRLFLVLPDDKMTDLLNVAISWHDFERINWQTVQAVAANPNKDQYEIVGKSGLLSSVFMAGDFDLHQVLTPYGIVKVAMQKSDWRFTDEEFSSLARRIVQSEREFFMQKINPDAEPFLISLIEVARNLQGISISGTSLHNSFAMFANPKAQLMQTDLGEPNTTIGFVLAHEMMHQWIGHEVQTNENPETLGYWFTEGFTDYFTLQVLKRDNIINLQTYVDMLNSFVRLYWLSPYKNLNNQKVAQNFWTNKDIQKMPYLRGFMIALVSDQNMRLQSNLRLRDLLQKMLNKTDGIANNTGISNRSLLFNIKNQITNSVASHLRDVMQHGDSIELDTNLLNPCLNFINKEFGAFDAGFDLDQSEVEKKIVGLSVNTGAYKAGLRNGQELAGFAFTNDSKELSTVSIYTDKQGSTKTFEFYPVGETTPVPQAYIVNSENCDAIL